VPSKISLKRVILSEKLLKTAATIEHGLCFMVLFNCPLYRPVSFEIRILFC
jgi:hypothetical protein